MIKAINFFAVSSDNMGIVAGMFARDGFIMPSPRNFGKRVRSFRLDLRSDVKTPAKKIQLKLALEKVLGMLL